MFIEKLHASVVIVDVPLYFRKKKNTHTSPYSICLCVWSDAIIHVRLSHQRNLSFFFYSAIMQMHKFYFKFKLALHLLGVCRRIE